MEQPEGADGFAGALRKEARNLNRIKGFCVENGAGEGKLTAGSAIAATPPESSVPSIGFRQPNARVGNRPSGAKH
jgi:hypothetical protein